MKLMTSTAIALAASISAPAAAQMGYGAPASQPPPQTAVQQGQAQQPAGQGPKITISSKAAKAVSDLQAAVKANDVANIPAKVAAAQAVAQTKDDRYAIARLQLNAALAAKNNAAEAQALDAIAASGFLPGNQVADLYNALGVQFYNAKQFDLAANAFQKSVAVNPQNPDTQKLLAEALNSQGKRAEGAAALQKALQLSAASGKKPDEALYKRAVGMAYEAKSANAVELGREWLAAYPSPDSWSNALAIYRNLDNPDPNNLIDILRLERATNSLGGVGDFHAYAYEASNQANFGEAKAVIAEGLASGKIKATDPVIQEVQGVLRAKPTPTAAELATAEKGAREPQAFLRVGDRYYGAGNFTKAAELYKEALAKGADKNLANLRLGEALARSGDKAGATAAFNAVSGPMADIAKFWLIYIQRQA
jgi:tetratricopeptide (TPR) repeat protein